MIKLSTTIPEIVPDVENKQAITEYLTAVKLAVEEIARKAKSIQTEVIAAAPTVVTQFEVEGEDIRCSADNKTYTLFNGSIKSHQES